MNRSHSRGTPALRICEQAGVDYQTHTFEHDPRAQNYGAEAALALGVEPSQVFKTLVLEVDTQPVCVVVPVTAQAALKCVALAHGGKRAAMMAPRDVARITGYVLGGVSVLGQKRALPTYLDDSVNNWNTIFISAGRRGLELQIKPSDLQKLTSGVFGNLATISDPHDHTSQRQ